MTDAPQYPFAAIHFQDMTAAEPIVGYGATAEDAYEDIIKQLYLISDDFEARELDNLTLIDRRDGHPTNATLAFNDYLYDAADEMRQAAEEDAEHIRIERAMLERI